MKPPRVRVAVAVRGGDWREAIPDPRGLCRRAARAALARAAAAGHVPASLAAVEISVVLADDGFLRNLNRRYRGRNGTTNVLSFPAYDDLTAATGRPADAALPLGDVVVAYETVVREAAAQAKPLDHHLGHMVVHGVLHLLGLDHVRAGEAAVMEPIEVAALSGLGIADPYRPAPASDA